MTLLMRDRENVKIGEYVKSVSSIRDGRQEFSRQVFIKMLKLSENEYDKIIFYLDEHPDWDNGDIAEAIIRLLESCRSCKGNG